MTQQWVKSSLSFPLHDAKRLKEIKTKWYVAASLNKTDTCKARTNRVTKQEIIEEGLSQKPMKLFIERQEKRAKNQ